MDSRPGIVYVFGHSYGGVSALEATFFTKRISRLILYEPPVQEAVENNRAVTARMERLIRDGEREQAAAAFLTEVVQVSPNELAAMRTRPAWAHLVSTIDGQLRQMRALDAYHFESARMRTVRLPTLLLVGGDTKSPYLKQAVDSLQTSLPNATRVVLVGQQHTAMDTGAIR